MTYSRATLQKVTFLGGEKGSRIPAVAMENTHLVAGSDDCCCSATLPRLLLHNNKIWENLGGERSKRCRRKRQWKLSLDTELQGELSQRGGETQLYNTSWLQLEKEDLIQLTNDRTIKRKQIESNFLAIYRVGTRMKLSFCVSV